MGRLAGARDVDAPRSAPPDGVRQVLDGVEAGALEVIADDLTRDVRAGLHQPGCAFRAVPAGGARSWTRSPPGR
jgi:hypothetical protein